MIKKIIPGLILITAIICFFTSCMGESGPAPDLVVWTGVGDQEMAVLKQITENFNRINGVNVTIIKVPFTELKIKYQIAAPAGQGPDLLLGPNDWVGTLATAGLIEPLSDTDMSSRQKSSYNPKSLTAMTYGDKLYGIPMLMETIAVIYNSRLVKTEPENMDELLSQAVAFSRTGKGNYGFFFEATNLYFAWPFLSGYGSKIFGTTNGALDINKVEFNSPETAAGMKFLQDLSVRHGLLPDGATTDMMSGIFFKESMPFCLNGPWMLGDLKEKGIEYKVMPLPALDNGKMPQPFFGVQGVMMNRLVTNRPLAVKFMHYINEPENQKLMCMASGRIPTRYDTLQMVSDMEDIQQFAKAIEFAEPMPNHPAVSAVWVPINEALELVIKQGKDPQEVLPVTVKRIKDDIRIMTE